MGIEPNHYRLVSLKGMLKLESLGMKTRGGALRPRLAREFGLKPRSTYDEFIGAINKKLEGITDGDVAT